MLDAIKTRTPLTYYRAPEKNRKILAYNNDFKIDLFLIGNEEPGSQEFDLEKLDFNRQKFAAHDPYTLLTQDPTITQREVLFSIAKLLYHAAKEQAAEKESVWWLGAWAPEVAVGSDRERDEAVKAILKRQISDNIENPDEVLKVIIDCWNTLAPDVACGESGIKPHTQFYDRFLDFYREMESKMVENMSMLQLVAGALQKEEEKPLDLEAFKDFMRKELDNRGFKYRQLLLPSSLESDLGETFSQNARNDLYTLLQNPAAEQSIENPLLQLNMTYTPQANTDASPSRKRGRSAFACPTRDEKQEESEDNGSRSKKKYTVTLI